MNMITNLNSEQALHNALLFAGIENEEFVCLLNRYKDGLYHLLVRTIWMKYEFYVEASIGEVLGMNTEPLLYREGCSLCEPVKEALASVA